MNSGSNPDGSDAFVAAVGWVNGLFGGAMALAIAVIAVATVGLMLISGRMDVRRSMRVILGCFIVFGASTIASGIVSAMAGSGTANMQAAPPPPPLYPSVPARPSSPNTPYDPYAGAALPPRR